jgi:hypothetical protein
MSLMVMITIGTTTIACFSVSSYTVERCYKTKNNTGGKEWQNEVIKLPGKTLILLRIFIDGYIHIVSHIQGRVSIETVIYFVSLMLFDISIT